MTAPLAHTAIGAKPSASTTGRIQRGGRPVATTNLAPVATALRMASRVRGVIVSASLNNVPSTSHAMSAGKVIPTARFRDLSQSSMQSALVTPGPGHTVGSVLLHPRLQLREAQGPGILLVGRAAT